MQPISLAELARILEAVLLAAHEPVSPARLASLFEPAPTKKEIEAALSLLQEQSQERSFELTQVASGYRYQIGQRYAPWVARLFEIKPPKNSRALVETLAFIAYRQPASRGDIEQMRGVAASSQIMRTLLDRGWIRVVGYKDTPGKPALYGTTDVFLDYLGLANLSELPPLPEAQPAETLLAQTKLDIP